jgi:hypothetical protein
MLITLAPRATAQSMPATMAAYEPLPPASRTFTGISGDE